MAREVMMRSAKMAMAMVGIVGMMAMMAMIWKSVLPQPTSLVSQNSASPSFSPHSSPSHSAIPHRSRNRRLRLPSLQDRANVHASSSADADTAPHRQDHAAVSAAAVQLRACVAQARDVKDGIWCLSRLLSRLPPALEHRALAVAQEVAPTVDQATPPQGLTINLETCLAAAKSPDARTFCLADLLARIPPKALAVAARQAEETPVVDWDGDSADATKDAESFLSCVQSSEVVPRLPPPPSSSLPSLPLPPSPPSTSFPFLVSPLSPSSPLPSFYLLPLPRLSLLCLFSPPLVLPPSPSSSLVDFPPSVPSSDRALVDRSTRLVSSLPPRTVNTDSSEMQTPNFVKCLKLAKSGDSAIYCLSNYLIHLPQDQVPCPTPLPLSVCRRAECLQVERAYIFYKTQRIHPTLEDVHRVRESGMRVEGRRDRQGGREGEGQTEREGREGREE
eukprot:202311-Hanusia_phi.AAC.1